MPFFLEGSWAAHASPEHRERGTAIVLRCDVLSDLALQTLETPLPTSSLAVDPTIGSCGLCLATSEEEASLQRAAVISDPRVLQRAALQGPTGLRGPCAGALAELRPCPPGLRLRLGGLLRTPSGDARFFTSVEAQRAQVLPRWTVLPTPISRARLAIGNAWPPTMLAAPVVQLADIWIRHSMALRDEGAPVWDLGRVTLKLLHRLTMSPRPVDAAEPPASPLIGHGPGPGRAPVPERGDISDAGVRRGAAGPAGAESRF